MKCVVKTTPIAKVDVDALLWFHAEEEDAIPADLPAELHPHIRESMIREQFEGKEGQILTVSSRGSIAAYKLLIVGTGKRKDVDVFRLQKAVATAVYTVQTQIKPARIAIVIPPYWTGQFDGVNAVAAVVEAVHLASYRFLRYKSEEERKKLRMLEEVILPVSAARVEGTEKGIALAEIFSRATIMARDLVNEPSEVTTPTHLASVAQDIGKSSKGAVSVKISDKSEIEKMKMGAFLGVARGSDEPPKLIRLEYNRAKRGKTVVLIGKGITFDTGGLSLKSADHMETMKLDMAGAAAVLAVFSVLPILRPEVHVIGYIASCENMPSGKALKPGDILRAYNGKTIEVLNTDAEGRLTLADVLSYAADNDKPQVMIDLATLTGACMVALGNDIAGLWSTSDTLLSSLEKSAVATGEKIWRMPLENEYMELVKSHIADLKNTQTGRYGGAVTAALFLSEFTGTIPWAHLDIAGPSYNEKSSPLVPKGGTGFGVRLLLHFLSTYRSV